MLMHESLFSQLFSAPSINHIKTTSHLVGGGEDASIMALDGCITFRTDMIYYCSEELAWLFDELAGIIDYH